MSFMYFTGKTVFVLIPGAVLFILLRLLCPNQLTANTGSLCKRENLDFAVFSLSQPHR